MKSNNSRSPVFKFMQANLFVKSVIIHENNKTSYFPNVENGKKYYFDTIIAHYKKKSTPGSHMLLCTQKEFIYFYQKKETIYICECSNNISISRVKMEFNTFIEDSNKQGKFPMFITSFFNR
ncbi:MAG: hypothetical protein ABFR31_01775 [Thermodesulfobacteriota bacterium]